MWSLGGFIRLAKVLRHLYVILMFVFLNKFVILRICGEMYVKVAHFLFFLSCGEVCFVLCSIWLFLLIRKPVPKLLLPLPLHISMKFATSNTPLLLHLISCIAAISIPYFSYSVVTFFNVPALCGLSTFQATI